MNIIDKFNENINGVLETFDRMIINGYIGHLHSHRLFLYYLIQNNVLLKEFNQFALSQTESLCNHIDNYIKENNVTLQYLSDGKLNKSEIARKEFSKDASKTGLISAFSVVEVCNTTTVKPNREIKKLEVTTRSTRCKHYYLLNTFHRFFSSYISPNRMRTLSIY